MATTENQMEKKMENENGITKGSCKSAFHKEKETSSECTTILITQTFKNGLPKVEKATLGIHTIRTIMDDPCHPLGGVCCFRA